MKTLAALTLKAKIIIAAASAAVVAAGTVGTVMLLNNKEESYRVVKVFETQGQYNTVDRDTSGTLDAYSGMNLQNGDVVTTGADSNIRISLDGDKYILIDHDSEVHLVAENSAKDSKTVIELKKGEILNEITEPLSENSTYEVNTPKATMAVRGTSFYVQTEELDNGSYMTDLEVVHGKVAVWLYDENGDKKGGEVYVSEGCKVTIVIDPNESSENTPDVDGNAYFVYRTDDGGFIECKDTDPAPYKTDFSLMPDDVTAEYGSEITLPAVPTKTGYTGEWQIGGKAVETDYKVTEDVTVTAVYTHVKVIVCYVGGYSDGGNNDPTNFRLSNSTTGTLDYDMTAEELQSEIATWKESVDSYTAVKVVYDNTETSLSDLDNPLDIDSLPEITADTKVSDIVNDYEYDGVYRSFVRIYLVPAWENVYKVTFHDVDGEEIESHCSMGELLNDIPAAPENYTWVYTNGNNSTEEFTQDTWIEFDTDVYCGCKITVYEYTEGAWESTGSFAKK